MDYIFLNFKLRSYLREKLIEEILRLSDKADDIPPFWKDSENITNIFCTSIYYKNIINHCLYKCPLAKVEFDSNNEICLRTVKEKLWYKETITTLLKKFYKFIRTVNFVNSISKVDMANYSKYTRYKNMMNRLSKITKTSYDEKNAFYTFFRVYVYLTQINLCPENVAIRQAIKITNIYELCKGRFKLCNFLMYHAKEYENFYQGMYDYLNNVEKDLFKKENIYVAFTTI